MDEQTTYRWVAGPTSADEAARSLSRTRLRRRRTWVVLLALWVALVLYVFVSLGPMESTTARLAWAGGSVTVIWLVAFPLALGAGRRITRRRFGRRIGPGVELTSRFGTSSLELAGPLSRHELAYDGLDHVQRVGDWIHLKQLASPVLLIWPAALFPEHELERVQRLVADRAPPTR